jgi:membrane dipeptidase
MNKKIIVDAHLDLLKDVQYKREGGRTKIIEEDYLPLFKKGGVNVIVSSIFIDSQYLPEMGLKRALGQVECLYEEVKESGKYLALCKSHQDILNAIEANQIAILLSFEGVEPLSNDIGLLSIFYELGVRLVGITWSRRNFAADGCFLREVKHGTQGGLTDFGVQLIKKADELGMIVDISHINDVGFQDVIKISTKPIIASHSDCRSIVNLERNLSDEMIQDIAKKGGIIGVNAINFLSTQDDSISGVQLLADQIDHIAQLVGIEHVGFGFDLCDMISEYQSPLFINSLSRKPFDVIRGYEDVPLLLEELKHRGYEEDDIRKIAGLNFMNLYKEILK